MLRQQEAAYRLEEEAAAGMMPAAAAGRQVVVAGIPRRAAEVPPGEAAEADIQQPEAAAVAQAPRMAAGRHTP
jgi:hypothetical protein